MEKPLHRIWLNRFWRRVGKKLDWLELLSTNRWANYFSNAHNTWILGVERTVCINGRKQLHIYFDGSIVTCAGSIPRLWIRFWCCCLHKLTQDHLDYHVTMGNYFEAKKILFSYLKPSSCAVINQDDQWGIQLLRSVGVRKFPMVSTQLQMYSQRKSDSV